MKLRQQLQCFIILVKLKNLMMAQFTLTYQLTNQMKSQKNYYPMLSTRMAAVAYQELGFGLLTMNMHSEFAKKVKNFIDHNMI